jgi:peptide/nickel transport system permease protein
MRRYLLQRLVWLVLVLVGASLLTFTLGAIAPGDPAQIILQNRTGQPPTESQIDAARQDLGLDRPLPAQYVSWLAKAAHGDLGRSWATGEQVAQALVDRIPATAFLAVVAAVFTVLIALPVGVLAAYRRNALTDHVSRVGALIGASIPNYFLAYVLILVFGVMLQALPVFGADSPAHVVLPALALALGVSATLTRLTRSSMLEVLREPYMKVGKSKGLRPVTLLFRDALRNALIPIVTAGALTFAGLLNGVFIIEWVFAWPGLGKLAVDAIHARDYPLLQGFVLFTGTIYVLFNFATDIAYGWLDPRIRDEVGWP